MAITVKPPTWKHHRMPNLSTIRDVETSKILNVGAQLVAPGSPRSPNRFSVQFQLCWPLKKMLQTEACLDWKGKTWKKMKNDLWIRNQKPYIAMNQRWNDFKWQLLHILSKNGAHLGKQNWSSRSSSFHVFLRSMYCFHQQIDRFCIGKTCEQSVRPETEFMPLVSDSV